MDIKNVTWDCGDRVELSDGWRELERLSAEGWEVKSSHSFLLRNRSYVTVILQRSSWRPKVQPVHHTSSASSSQVHYQAPAMHPVHVQ